MMLRAIILGSGSSGGVPRPGGPDGRGAWGACDPTEPKNRRMRCSLLVQCTDDATGWEAPDLTTILIDTSPDMREQLLMARCGRLDSVLYTHEHADQAHGIDDLRVIAINMRQRIPVYIDEATSGGLLRRFAYCFEQAPGTSYPAILDRKVIPPVGETFTIEGPTGAIKITSFLQEHGSVQSLGFIFGCQGSEQGKIAYSSDVNDLPEESFKALEKCDTWIVDALRETEHPSHAHLAKTLTWIDRVQPKRGVLTNLHIDLDYQTLKNKCPDGVIPAYDGLMLETCCT